MTYQCLSVKYPVQLNIIAQRLVKKDNIGHHFKRQPGDNPIIGIIICYLDKGEHWL